MWVRRGHQKLLGGVRDKDFLELAFEVICSRGRGDGIEVKEELGQFPDITLAPIKRLPHGSLRYKAIKRGITIDARGQAASSKSQSVPLGSEEGLSSDGSRDAAVMVHVIKIQSTCALLPILGCCKYA